MKRFYKTPELSKGDKEVLIATMAAGFIAMLVILTISSIQVVERGTHFAASTYTLSFSKNEG